MYSQIHTLYPYDKTFHITQTSIEETFSEHLNMGLETSSQFHAAPEDASPTQQPYLSLGTSTGLLQALIRI